MTPMMTNSLTFFNIFMMVFLVIGCMLAATGSMETLISQYVSKKSAVAKNRKRGNQMLKSRSRTIRSKSLSDNDSVILEEKFAA